MRHVRISADQGATRLIQGHHHQQVEQTVEVPVPMTQEEVVQVPEARACECQEEVRCEVSAQQRVQQQEVERLVEVPVPMMEEEIVHVPKIITQTHQQQQQQTPEALGSF